MTKATNKNEALLQRLQEYRLKKATEKTSKENQLRNAISVSNKSTANKAVKPVTKLADIKNTYAGQHVKSERKKSLSSLMKKENEVEKVKPKISQAKENKADSKPKTSRCDGENSRKLQLEEWRRKKEAERNFKGKAAVVAGGTVTSKQPRRQTFANSAAVHAANKRQLQGKAEPLHPGARRQTFCATTAPQQRPVPTRRDTMLVTNRRETFSKSAPTAVVKEKTEDCASSDAPGKRTLESKQTANQSVRNHRTKESPRVNHHTRVLDSRRASGIANRRRTFEAHSPTNSLLRKSGSFHSAGRNTVPCSQAVEPIRSTEGAQRTQSDSAIPSTSARRLPVQKPEPRPAARVEQKALTKKRKLIYVKSRIDTGLSNLKHQGAPAKPSTNAGKVVTCVKQKPTSVAKTKVAAETTAATKLPASKTAIAKAPAKPTGQAKPVVVKPEVKKTSVRHAPSQDKHARTGSDPGRTVSLNKRRSCLVTSKTPRHVSPEKRRKTIGSVGDADRAMAPSPSRIPVAMTPCRQHVRFRSPSSGVKRSQPRTPLPNTPAPKDMAMRAKLNAWLTARGKTPTRYRHLMCFHENDESQCRGEKVDAGLTVHELSLQQEQIERESFAQSPLQAFATSQQSSDAVASKLANLLNECALLLQSGCPTESVSQWLGEIERSMPSALQAAKYWVIRAELVEQEGGDNLAVIDVYEQAVRHHASPPEEVARALEAFVTRMNTRQTVNTKPPNASENSRSQRETSENKHTETAEERDDKGAKSRAINEDSEIEDEVFESSSVKYCMSQATPFFKKLRAQADGLPTPRAVITPVRRSTRKSVTSLPPMLRDHDIVLESLDDLSPASKDKVVYQTNKALIEEFDAVASDVD